ncbi:acyltransferase family protein [Dyadobacter sandarakinus]|uniref:Acyltransferase n=1 Tax=Dyadobacter sandarakinus TaxID=2747268 RepID=A0ABX7IAP1_9BACT|nr:acyltransferase [Dyadobacter sandarakinus]QRR03174.1 acyltransferase [Dyadobacter sandarakinus]
MTKHTISLATHRRNNFDFLRLLFAAFVIVTHVYPLTGSQECDGLCQLTHGQYTFSVIAVRGFFVISGYLIFQSLERSEDLTDFYWKRVLRLFPALAVVLLLTVILGPFVYENDTPYLLNKQVRTYIPNNLRLYRLQYGIPGIFDQNPHKSAINGSLWTIPFEFTMYIAVSLLFFIKRKRTIVIVVLLVAYLVLAKLDVFNFTEIQQWKFFILDWYLIELGVYFAAGSLLAAVRIADIPPRYLTIILALSLGMFVYATGKPIFSFASVTLLPVIVLSIGLLPIYGITHVADRVGDLSYGIYIYGFPVQQTLVYYFGMDHATLIFPSLIIAAMFAYLSWHWVEAPALRLKNLKPMPILIQKMRRITRL